MMNRREFLRQSRSAVAAATPFVSAAAVASTDLYRQLSEKFEKQAANVAETLGRLQQEARSVVARVDRIEFQQQLILALLVISFMVDGGLGWALIGPELAA